MDLACAWCGRRFSAPGRRGPPPRYCSPSHRQRAYEARRRSTRADLLPPGGRPIGRHAICIRVLGPLEVLRADGSTIPLGPVVRRVLASLALRPRQTVATERLIDGIWPGLPDDVAKHRLQVAVSKLRRLLADEMASGPGGELIHWSAPGYVLDTADEQLDWIRFRRLKQAGERSLSRGAPDIARSYLEAALSLWTGPDPLTGMDVALGDVGVVASLTAERDRTHRQLLEARLQLGETEDLIPELEQHVAADPFDVGSVRRLALAHHRSGRSDRALALCRRHLERMADLSAPETRETIVALQHAILRRDPSIDAVNEGRRGTSMTSYPALLAARWEPYVPAPSGPLPAELALLLEHDDGVVLAVTDTGVEAGFEVVRPAMRAAIALQRAGGAEPLVRVGVAVAPSGGPPRGFEGPSMVRARLLAAVARAGQTLVSPGRNDDPLSTSAPENAELHPLGTHRLNALTPPAPVFRVVAPDTPVVEEPPHWSHHAQVHHLPTDPFPFVGREVEVTEIVDRLIGAPVLTLTGAPGSGKTRLASHVATGMSDEFRDGAWFVGLETVSEPALVAPVVADALAVPRGGAVPAKDALVRHLTGRHLLLVLDNCEHLGGAVGVLVERIGADCPDVRVLVTSRRPLGLRSEVVVVVAPLEPPPPGPPELVRANAAVRLLLDRMELTERGPSDVELDAAARICRAVDGVPLALVLAAARARELGLVALADVFDESLRDWRGLVPLASTQDPEDRGLGPTLEWSYRLLEDDEQQLLDALAVFSTSFGVDDAHRVSMPGSTRAEVAGILGRLTEASLVIADASGTGGSARFQLLQPIKDFARDKLAARGGHVATAMRRRHALHFLGKVAAAEPHVRGRQDLAVLDQLESVLPDLYAAVRWAVEEGETRTSLDLVGYLWVFWLVRGRLGEGRHLIEAALGADTSVSQERAKALIALSQMAWYEGDMARVRSGCQEALLIGEALEDPWTLSWALLGIAAAEMLKGDDDGIPERIAELIPIFRELGNDWDTGQALQTLGGAAWHRGQYERAERALREALDHYRSLGHPTLMASLIAHGILTALLGDLDAAVAEVEEGIAAVHEAGDLVGLAHALCHRAAIARYAGDHDQVRRYYRESIQIAAEISQGWSILWAMAGLAATEELGLHVRPERLADSVKLLARVQSTSAEVGISLAPRERELITRDLGRARERLGEQRFRTAYEDGESLSVPEAIELALRLS